MWGLTFLPDFAPLLSEGMEAVGLEISRVSVGTDLVDWQPGGFGVYEIWGWGTLRGVWVG